MAPAGTPREVIDRVHRDSAKGPAVGRIPREARAAGHGAGGELAGGIRRRDSRGKRALGEGDPRARAAGQLKVDAAQVEDIARELYVRALKILPPDVKEGFARLAASETDATAKTVLGTMITNIRVAEDTENLLCQDTGIPIYNVTIGRGVEVAART
jgi:hypothetical protein